MSHKHLHRYANEFVNRHKTDSYNTMQFIGLTDAETSGRGLTYEGLINGN